MLIALLLPLLTLPQADVRARVAAQEEAVASFTFDGFDAGDASVKASADHFCGVTEQCAAAFLDARSVLVRHAVVDRREKKALALLKQNTEGQFTDWRLANTLYEARYHPPLPGATFGTTTRCDTYVGKRTISTRCSTY